MAAYECISGTVTGVGATLTNWTLNGNDSLRLRTTPGNVYLLNVTTDVVVPSAIRVLSPLMHDPVSATVITSGGNGALCLPLKPMQKLYSADLLQVLQSGSAGVGDIDSGCIFIYYDSLPGLDQNLISYREYCRRVKNYKMWRITHTPSFTGGYGTASAFPTNATLQPRKANTNYAVIGYDNLGQLPIGTMTIQGADTNGLRIPMPYFNGDETEHRNFFLTLGQLYPDWPMIPVINSENFPNTFLESVHSSVFTGAGNFGIITAELV